MCTLLADHLPRRAGLCSTRQRSAAFTLIELLGVIAVIAILAGVLFPTSALVRNVALKVRTKAQFQQWVIAVEEFRAEYGHYPQISSDGLLDTSRFLAAVTGRDHLGVRREGAALNGNTRGLRFYSPATNEILGASQGASRSELIDGFGNSQIGVLMDRDGDGLLRGAELVVRALAAGNSQEGFSSALVPSLLEVSTGTPIAARVAFYSVGQGKSAETFVCSWK